MPSALSETMLSLPSVKVWHIVIGLFVYVTYLIFYRLILRPFVFSPLRKVSGPPMGNIVLGQARTVFGCPLDIPVRNWTQKYGPVFRFIGIAGTEWLIIIKPEVLHQLLVKDSAKYPRPDFVLRILSLVTGFGLFSVTGDEHKQMRKAMNPAFSAPNLMAQSHMYWESIDRLIDIFNDKLNSAPDGEVFQVFEWMGRLPLDIICDTAFGYKANSLHDPNNNLAVASHAISCLQTASNLGKLCLLMSIPFAPRLLASEWTYRYRSLLKFGAFSRVLATLIGALYQVRKISEEILEDKLREAVPISDIDAKRDIMSILVRENGAEKEKRSGHDTLADRAMIDHVVTFILAGHETIAASLSWTLWLLANDKESQRKLRRELTPVMAQNSHPDNRTLKDLKWLDCVVMESLRVMPPAPVTCRIAKEDGVLDGMTIPKGTFFYIPFRVINTWKDTWGEDAEEFHPERWLKLPETYSKFSMLPFGAGPHGCIGKTMAVYEMKAILAGLIVNFEFDFAYQGQKVNPEATITMIPPDGMPLRVRRIQHAD